MVNLHNYFEYARIGQYKSLAIYGTKKSGERILEELRKYPIDHVYIIDNDNCPNIGGDFHGICIQKLIDVVNDVDAIVIASRKYHLAIERRLERETTGFNIPLLNPFRMRDYFPSNRLIINKYSDGQDEFLFEEDFVRNQEGRVESYKERVFAYVEEALKEVPLFRLVEIETFNRCNGTCAFCPVNKNNDIRKPTFMEKSVFKKIIGELESLDYHGRISLFSNNEPLLDNRIFEFSEYVREHLPKARIHMFTNGTLLTLKKFIQLVPLLDELIIDNYTSDLSLIKPVEEIKNFCEKNPEYIKKVSIVLRKPDEILTSRGGDAPNRTIRETYSGCPCPLLFQQMIIRPTGEVSLCCNDPFGKYTMGDLKKETILEVWYGKKYEQLRKKLAQGRELVEHCKYCDVFSLYL